MFLVARLPVKLQPYAGAAGGFLVRFVIGGLHYSGTNLVTYIASYLIIIQGEEISLGLLSFLFCTARICFGVGSVLCGWLCHKLSFRGTVLIGSGMTVVGVFTTYWSISTSYGATIVTLAILPGIGTGIANTPAIACPISWWPHRKGTATAAANAAVVAGGCLYVLVETLYVNQNNAAPQMHGLIPVFTDSQLLARVPLVFPILGVISLVVSLASVAFLEEPPLGYSAIDNYEEIDVPLKTARKSPAFYLLLCTAFSLECGIEFMASYAKLFGETFVSNDYFLTIALALAFAISFFARLLWGYSLDKVSYQTNMCTCSAALAVAFFLFYPGESGGRWSYAILLTISYCAIAGNYSLISYATAHAFGTPNFPKIYGWVAAVTALASGVVGLTATVLLDNLGFRWFFIISGGFETLAFTATLLIVKTKHGAVLGKDPRKLVYGTTQLNEPS